MHLYMIRGSNENENSSSVLGMSERSVLDAVCADSLLAKGFDTAWIDALFKQGEARWYRGKELQFIGQPVGGQYAGQLYLGGDGRLWYWDLFNERFNTSGKEGDTNYNEPLRPDDWCKVSSGFLVEVGERIRLLDSRGFKEVAFRGEYPIARVRMSDPDSPVDVELEAFSPFCPTDSVSSSLPATVMSYRLTNTSAKQVKLRAGGWLENAANRTAVKKGEVQAVTEAIKGVPNALLLTAKPLREKIGTYADSGSMALSLLNHPTVSLESGHLPEEWNNALSAAKTTVPTQYAVLRSEVIALGPGESTEIRFAVSWHFPEVQRGPMDESMKRLKHQRSYYHSRFADAGAVAHELLEHHNSLIAMTRYWRDTWYDSSLPVWFLDRTFFNVSTLATSAAMRFHDASDPSLDGRVYFYEGTFIGPGTCTHVTHYEQAFGRLFPDAARAQRKITDYHAGWRDDHGYIGYRAELDMGDHFGIPHAIDGHAGTILRTWREHTTSTDDAFLRSVWTRVKQATQFMIDQDAGRGFFENYVPEADRNGQPDGILSGPQYNTLDKVWDGTSPWLSGMYLASLRAAAAMAEEMGDREFAATCSTIAETGGRKLAALCFEPDYGYYVQHPVDTAKYVNSNKGCHIDQVLGDYWTHQAGLPQVLPRGQTRSALGRLFEHNFHRRIGDYRKASPIKVSRDYCDDDEPGTVICAFPHGGAKLAGPSAKNTWDNLVVGYFSECMTGFTYQAAAHMIDEGLITEGLALCRAIHDRYAGAPLRRNPFNEIEYGNHYTRAMSSYAAYIAACGFEYHGPTGVIGFDPKLSPEDFKAAFTAAEGWGSFHQKFENDQWNARLEITHGQLKLQEIRLPWLNAKASLTLNGRAIPATPAKGASRLTRDLSLKAGDALEITEN